MTPPLNCLDDHFIEEMPVPFSPGCSPYLTNRFSEKLQSYLLTYSPGSCIKVAKTIVIGDVSVGKTCLVNRFCRKIFDSNYKTTIGVDFEVENFNILNVPFILQIWDTAGQERFKSIAQSYYRGAHAVVIVFDLTNPDTLDNSETWYREASQTFSTTTPFLFLVGTKKDLIKQYAYKHMELSAKKIATKMNAEYWAVSSKTGKNINNLFRRIAALSFNDFMRMEISSAKSFKKEIGTELVALNKQNTNKEEKCRCSSNNCLK